MNASRARPWAYAPAAMRDEEAARYLGVSASKLMETMEMERVQNRRTRFARLFDGGGMIVEPPNVDFLEARRSLLESADDDDVEILEVEITVVRSHGKPRLQVAREHSVTCPTCGEEIQVAAPDPAP